MEGLVRGMSFENTTLKDFRVIKDYSPRSCCFSYRSFAEIVVPLPHRNLSRTSCSSIALKVVPIVETLQSPET